MLVTLAGSLYDRKSGGLPEWNQYVRDSNVASFESGCRHRREFSWSAVLRARSAA